VIPRAKIDFVLVQIALSAKSSKDTSICLTLFCPQNCEQELTTRFPLLTVQIKEESNFAQIHWFTVEFIPQDSEIFTRDHV
jgi:hypothetical protein